MKKFLLLICIATLTNLNASDIQNSDRKMTLPSGFHNQVRAYVLTAMQQSGRPTEHAQNGQVEIVSREKEITNPLEIREIEESSPEDIISTRIRMGKAVPCVYPNGQGYLMETGSETTAIKVQQYHARLTWQDDNHNQPGFFETIIPTRALAQIRHRPE